MSCPVYCYLISLFPVLAAAASASMIILGLGLIHLALSPLSAFPPQTHASLHIPSLVDLIGNLNLRFRALTTDHRLRISIASSCRTPRTMIQVLSPTRQRALTIRLPSSQSVSQSVSQSASNHVSLPLCLHFFDYLLMLIIGYIVPGQEPGEFS